MTEEELKELVKARKPSSKRELSKKAAKAREKEAEEDGLKAPPVKVRKRKAR